MSNLSREFFGRNQSERILDKHIFKKSNIVQITKLEKDIEQQKQKKVKIEEKQENNQLLPHVALVEVMKHLTNQRKQLIVIQKVKVLFEQFIEKLYIHQIFDTLFLISQQHYTNKITEIYTAIKEITQIVEHKIKLDDNFKIILNILKLQLVLYHELETDDSFVFHQIVKQVQTYVEKLGKVEKIPLNLQKQLTGELYNKYLEIQPKNELDAIKNLLNKNKIKDNQPQKDVPNYEYTLSDEFLRFIEDEEFRLHITQQFLLNCIRQLVNQQKYGWAKPTITQFMMNINYNLRDQFTDLNRKIFDQYLKDMQQNQKALQTQIIKRETMDGQQMEDYLKPNHDVVDSRASIDVDDGIGQWHMRQCGL